MLRDLLSHVEALYTLGVVLTGVVLYVITKVVRTSNQKRQDTQEQFNLVVEQLSKDISIVSSHYPAAFLQCHH